MSNAHVGDKKIKYIIEVQEKGKFLDIQLADVTEFKFKNPSDTITTLTATFVTDGSDGLLEAETATSPSMYDEGGEWEIQVHCHFPGDEDWHTFSVFQTVEESLGL